MILKIIGIAVVSFILQGIHRACIMARRDLKHGNFHGQDPKIIKAKYIQMVIFDIILWFVLAILIVSFASQLMGNK